MVLSVWTLTLSKDNTYPTSSSSSVNFIIWVLSVANFTLIHSSVVDFFSCHYFIISCCSTATVWQSKPVSCLPGSNSAGEPVNGETATELHAWEVPLREAGNCAGRRLTLRRQREWGSVIITLWSTRVIIASRTENAFVPSNERLHRKWMGHSDTSNRRLFVVVYYFLQGSQSYWACWPVVWP